MKQDQKIVFNFALLFFLYLCVLDIAILYLHHTYSHAPGLNNLQQLKHFFYYIVLWECILVIVVSYVFFLLFKRYKRHKKEVTEFQDILVEAVSHRLGNFLAVQKINLELLRGQHNPRALGRIEESTARFENDFQQLIKIMSEFDFEERKHEPVDIKTVAEDMLPRFDGVHRVRVHKRLQSGTLQGNILEIQTLLFILVENAVKYADSCIKIKTGVTNGRSYCFLLNDINPAVSIGSGIGQNIARRLCERNNLFLRSNERAGWHRILVVEGRQGA